LTRFLLLASLALALALTAPATAQRRHRGGPDGSPRTAYANPSAGIAADIALSQLSGGKKGRWYALRETAAPGAVMFVPQMVLAEPWLKGRSDPAPALDLEPYQVWASCDGTTVVTSGLRRDAGSEGWYTNVWQRQANGGYKWVFRHHGGLASPLAAPDMIAAKVAECPPRRTPAGGAVTPGRRGKRDEPAIVLDPAGRSGGSRDGSLTWNVAVDPGGTHHFTASMRVNGEMDRFRDEKVAAAGS
jgi:hypothetical protein